MKARALVVLVLPLLLITTCLAADLPLTRVALFTSGVGYFEREGGVTGDATVELTFRADQVNDILKSLVLQDLGGGTIAPVTYAPQEPLGRTLGSFSVNIGDNPSLRQLWDRLRGASVRITTATATVEGTAFGSEVRIKRDEQMTYQVEYLNLLTHKGLMQFAVSEVTSIKLLDPKLDADLQRALAAIDASRDTDRKAVTLAFKGQGQRDVVVGYLLETPIWKTTYRLVVQEEGLFLQGWALVENTTDDDWNNIGLSLISGRPVSFTQNLYQPLYLARPQVPVSVAPAARPRVYAGAIERQADDEQADRAGRGARGPTGPAGAAGPGMPGGPGGGGMGAPAEAMAAPAPPPAAKALRRLEQNAAEAMAAGEQVGTLFQYAINQPVTIPRQQSAMIPIINQKIGGDKVSVYNQFADPKRPLNGIRLKNTSNLHLMAGPITVFDGDAYGGDALIEDVPPGDERLLTYAMDLEVEVEAAVGGQPEELVTGRLADGILTLTWKRRKPTTYTLRSVSDEPRTVLVEHPLHQDWNLVEPKQADERTREVYRFRVPLEPKGTAKLAVVEEQPRLEQVVLTPDEIGRVTVLLERREVSQPVREAVGKLVKLQGELSTIVAHRNERQTRIKEIEQEQERIRNNMRELDRESDLYKQYVEKFTAQEAEFDKLRAETAELREQEAAKRQEISNYIAGLNIE